ncbi:phosphatidate cytidylyltransferase-like protein [Leptomonas pyrrhocoris]|uniref:Phosphatidate cytidylyltransferase n=1 Tax=Leptomonas pyrrhocoris TaxID=157538 RepID=A0A0N0VH26_LEPPY|nr:phosphatidate cytidylyltransferase-like protein [Leptomonas pyrrhocoris]KPA84904.1 phosphatidate cytidylyltransferase-like protein [Leptomonas pyrrhocoris]|eukprot:XP_015663343.1 phosphatidate cytidylyltransferase-like protein [Leptomonas pyrrhocoris]
MSRAPAKTAALAKPAAPARNRLGLTNLQVRAVTIATVGPSIIAFGAYSEKCGTLLVFLATFISGIEWSGLKRHLKVALLMSMDSPSSIAPETAFRESATQLAPGRDFVAGSPPPSPLVGGVPLCPMEYPLPVPPLSLYIIIKHIGWSLLVIAAYHGVKVFYMVLELYFLVFVVVTLTAHNRLEMRVGNAMDRLSHQLSAANQHLPHPKKTDPDKPRPPLLLADPGESIEARIAKAQRNYFISMELHMIAERQPTEQFLDFCLDIFGILWITGIIIPVFVYRIPNVGVPWLASTIIGNFMNDIAALVVGRGLRTLRERYGAVYDVTGEVPAAETGKRPLCEASWVKRLILRGPHQLYRAISPNKSVEGAVAGVVMNAATFSGLMFWFYARLVDAPAPHLVAPVFQHVGLWLVIGAVMGVLGVYGDLLQSLLKRTARVKDAGFIIPGHGGMLDRIDGMLLVFPFMYGALNTIMKMS